MSSSPDTVTPGTIVLIHGLWLTPRSWELWARRYQNRGYMVLAAAWPGMEADVEELNRDPSPIARLDLGQVVGHYDTLIRGLGRPPVIMGHCLGGTVMQILLDRGLGAAGIGVACGTARGVRDLRLPVSTAAGPAPTSLKGGGAVSLTAEQFHNALANTLSRGESDRIYQRHHVPAPVMLLHEFANAHPSAPARADFHPARRAPLMCIAFGEDHIAPPGTSRNQGTTGHPATVTESTEFPGRPHFPGAPGWEQVADFALRWALEHSTTPP
jgi:alpha-beta hydrolase superfamily lysophospholipase